MTELRTDEALLDALRRSQSRPLSYDDQEKQRVSFVMGSLPETSGMTREQVRDVLDRMEGKERLAK